MTVGKGSLQGGYAGKFLRVNLSNSKTEDVKIDQEKLRTYLGGVGLGARILLDEVPEGVKPFDLENRLIFAAGPLSGTMVPGSGTCAVVTRGTLTGLAAAGSANGWFGARLKFAGYDGIIIQGVSPKLAYLLINDGKVEIRDASKYAGMDTYDTHVKLKEELGLPSASVAAIGPAGENKVRFACIVIDSGHVIATNGCGAVMGSKNLKAVVVNGKSSVPVKDEKKFKELAREWNKEMQATPMGMTVNAVGTAGFYSAAETTGWLPTKNMTTCIFEQHAKFNGDQLRADTKHVRRKPCHACPLHHCNEIEIPEGPFKGTVVDEPEYEGLAGFGALIGNTDVNATLKIDDVNDRLGMDLKECSFTIALAIDCYENGLLTKNDTDGLELKWGNVDAVLKLLPMIANRKGFGDLLAEGVYRLANKIGPAAVNKAIYTHKGIAPHVHDPRGMWGFLFGQVIGNMGTIAGFSSMELIPEPDLGYTEPVPKYTDPEALVASQVKLIGKYGFIECMGVCYLVSAVPRKLLADTLNALTGLSFTPDDVLNLGYRTETTLRLFNINHGWTREHDSVSPRLATAAPDGPNKGIAIKDVLDRMIDKHYAEMGWDKSGHPTPETLKRLEIQV